MKNILVFHMSNDMSGSPMVCSKIISCLKKSGHQITLCTNRESGGFLSNLDVKYVVVPYSFSKWKLLTIFRFFFAQMRHFFCVFKYSDKSTPIYVNAVLPVGALFAGYLLRRKVVCHVHENYNHQPLARSIFRFLIYLFACKIVYVSNQLLLEDGKSPEKDICLPNTVSDYISEASKTITKKTNSKPFRSLMVASLRDYKGVPEFIQLAKKFEAEGDFLFTIVFNSTDDEIEKYMQDKSPPTNITWHSSQQDLTSFYTEASLLLNLSRPDMVVETFGLTILEAMFFGTPCIAPPIGGPKDLVEHDVNGYLIDSRNVDDIFEKIKELASNDALYERLSEESLKKAQSFSPELYCKKLNQIVEELN